MYSWLKHLTNSLQEIKVGISKEDLIGGVIYGQSIGPLQLGGDNGADVAPVHANPADICCVTPVGPVQPSGSRDDEIENFGFALLQLKVLSVCVC